MWCGVLILLAGSSAVFGAECQGNDAFYFLTQPKGLIVAEGRRAFLECNVSNRCRVQFHWTQDERPIANTTRVYQQDSNLIITRVDRELDVGKFHCIATYMPTGITKQSQPASLQILWVSSNISVVVAESTNAASLSTFNSRPDHILLHCDAQGSDDIIFRWLRNGKLLSNGDGRAVKGEMLSLTKPTSLDNGVYACQVENTYGVRQSVHNLVLSLRDDKANILLLTPPRDTVVAKGSSALLNCQFNESLKVQWSRKSGPKLNVGEKYSIHSNGSLTISNVADDDKGYYECSPIDYPLQVYAAQVVIASLDDFSATSFSPMQSRYSVGEGQSTAVECIPPSGDPTPHMHWSVGGRQVPTTGNVRQSGVQLIVNHASMGDANEYVCHAWNAAGERRSTLKLAVTKKPVIITHPNSQTLTEDELVVLQCRFQASSLTNVAWIHNGDEISMSSLTKVVSWQTINGKRVQVVRGREIETTSTFSKIKIGSATVEDGGTYMCIVRTDSQPAVVSHSASLTVMHKLQFNPPPVDRNFERGKNVRVECKALGHTDVKVEWLHEGTANTTFNPPHTYFTDDNVRSQGGVLYFKEIDYVHAGKYKCVGINMQGTIMKTIEVGVFDPPTFTLAPINTTARTGEGVWLHCQVTGTPPTTTQWYYNRATSDRWPWRNWQEFANGTLYISNVTVENAGQYACFAGNKLGMRQRESTLCVNSAAMRTCGLYPGTTAVENNELDDRTGIETTTIVIACAFALVYIGVVVCFLSWCGYRRRRQYAKARTSEPPPLATVPMAGSVCSHRYATAEPGGNSMLNGGSYTIAQQNGVTTDYATTRLLAVATPSASSAVGHRAPNPSQVDYELPIQQDLQLSREHLHPKNGSLLGEGTFGKLYFHYVSSAHSSSACGVMVKYFDKRGGTSNVGDDHLHDQWCDELSIYSKCSHQNVAILYYECHEQSPWMAVYECSENGTVKQYMRESTTPFSQSQVVSIAYQTAAGLEHMASLGFVHRDVASRNLLLYNDLLIKVTCMSLRCDVQEEPSTSGDESDYYTYKNWSLPIRWMAPEAALDAEFSPASDVWSFGVCVWELYTKGALPYAHLDNLTVIDQMKTNKIHLTLSSNVPPPMADLMEKCWDAADPKSRLTIEECRRRIQPLHDSHSVVV